MSDNAFLKMIQTLRRHEEVVLYGYLQEFADAEAVEVTMFLHNEYRRETLNYPYQAPEFDAEAAYWAAKIIFIAAQLLLYRENKSADLPALLPGFNAELTPAAILSADLCLRFLPVLLGHLKEIDADDMLVPTLEDKLLRWHYSGISYPLEISRLDFNTILSNPCLQQLYNNRIIEYKNLALASHPQIKEGINASLGLFAKDFWEELKLNIEKN